jgi:tRNA threonylcarbamoyladenosine biosynthesis protein TsaB
LILAFSTSSAWTSAALISTSGETIEEGRLLAPMRASEACFRIIQSWNLGEVSWFVADLGPGSFTGVRVGVTVAKTLAFAAGAKCAGLNSFDLISQEKAVAIPSKKGEYFVRRPGMSPVRLTDPPDLDLVGYGPWFEGSETFPNAAAFAGIRLRPISPEFLAPEYLTDPSITPPKTPYADRGMNP